MKQAIVWTCVLVLGVMWTCARREAPPEEPVELKVAREFAEMLAGREFGGAHKFLTEDAQRAFPKEALETEWGKRIPIEAGPVTTIEIGNIETRWQDKEPGDVVRVYFGVGADKWHSATFKVIVSGVGDSPAIRKIEWDEVPEWRRQRAVEADKAGPPH